MASHFPLTNILFLPTALWLADYQLLAAALLLGVMLALAALRQPAQRSPSRSRPWPRSPPLHCCSPLPGWSLVHLLSEPRYRSSLLHQRHSRRLHSHRAIGSSRRLRRRQPSTHRRRAWTKALAKQPAAVPAKPIDWSAILVAAFTPPVPRAAIVVSESERDTVELADTVASITRFAGSVGVVGLPRLPAGIKHHPAVAKIASLL